MIKIIALLFTLLCSVSSWANSIKGKVLAQDKTPIAYANVRCYDDGVFVGGVVTHNDGAFVIQLPSDNHGGYILVASCMGFETDSIKAEPVGEEFVIYLKEQNANLSEVVVTAKRATFKETARGITAQVSGTALALKHDVQNILLQLPGLVFEKGKITLLNGEEPTYYINDRKVTDMGEVQSLDVSDIKDISIQNFPSAKYGAEVHAVVLIQLKNKQEGVGGYLKSLYSQSFYASHRQEASVSFTHRRLSLQGAYTFGHDKQMATHEATKSYYSDTEWLYRIEDRQVTSGNNERFNAGIDYKIGDNHSIGFLVQGSNNNSRPVIDMTLVLKQQGAEELYADGSMFSDLDRHDRRTTYTLYHRLKTKRGVEMDFNLNHVNNLSHHTQDISELYDAQTEHSDYDTRTRTKLWSGEYSLGFPLTKNAHLNVGTYYSRFDSRGGLTEQTTALQESGYEYMEEKWAGFTDYSVSMKNLSFGVGLRYEYSLLDWNNRAGDRTNYKDNALFPQFYISYKKGNLSSSLLFRKQIQRPPLSYLNGQKLFLNRFEYQIGNLNLRPQNAYMAEWKNRYKAWTFSISYSYIQDYISGVFKLVNGSNNRLYYTWENVGHAQIIDGKLSYRKSISSWWEVNASAQVQQPFLSGTYRGGEIDYNKPTLHLSLYQSFSFGKSGVLTLSNRVKTKGNQRMYITNGYHTMNLGYSVSLWNDRIGIDLNATDLFHNLRYSTTSRQGVFDYRVNENYDDWSYTVSVIFRFKKSKSLPYNKANTEDMNRL